MVDHSGPQVPAASRGATRRHRVEGGRRFVVKIRFTEAERDAIAARAAGAHVSIPRFMVDSSLARRPQAAVPAQLAAEVASLRRLVANLANNINQIARRINSGGGWDGSVTAAADSVRRAMSRLDLALAWFDSPQAVSTEVRQAIPGSQGPPRIAAPRSRDDPPAGSAPLRMFR